MDFLRDSQNTFTTVDFWLAGALLASGRKLLRLEWKGARAFFIFSDSMNCEALSHAHWAGDLTVTSLAFTDSLRRLKDQIRFKERQNEVI